MKPLHKIDLIFSVNGKTVAIQPAENLTIPEIVKLIKDVKTIHPERDCRVKRREVKDNGR